MFKSFFWGGFECATGLNARREPIDMIAATGHDVRVEQDYRLLRGAGLRVAREAVRWPLVDRGDGRYDFSSLDPMLAAASRLGIGLVFDLFHYGYPADADPFHPDFALRFADYCRAVAEYVGTYTDGPHVFTPVNEPSYLAWAGGDAALFAPHVEGRSYELKVALARCAIMGIDAIRSELPDARIVNVDPICHVVAPEDRPDLQEEARFFNETVVFESLDMIAGRLHPELGGSMRHLDIVGLNYYWTNQWEIGWAGHPLGLDDPRAWTVCDLLRLAYHRYGADLVLTETAHVDDGRAPWLDHVAREAACALDEGIPLRGVCLYPVLGMPEWHAPDEWAHMGLWDLDENLRRMPHSPSLEALRRAQERLEGLSFTPGGVPRMML